MRVRVRYLIVLLSIGDVLVVGPSIYVAMYTKTCTRVLAYGAHSVCEGAGFPIEWEGLMIHVCIPPCVAPRAYI